MAGSIAKTCNRLSQFLKNGGSLGDISLFEAAKIRTTTTMDLFPSSDHKGNASKSLDDVLFLPQMTIFYGGQVIVLDGFPADKAKEIMDAAKSASSSISNQLEAAAAGSSSDLPIARRTSLRRFLEKRKDRVATRAPYEMNKPVVGLSWPEESRSWINLEAPPSKHHLQLRL